MSRQRKKAYMPIVSVSMIYFALIACIINNCRQTTQDYVNEYKLHIEKIKNLEDDPLILAEEFMQTEYDKHWKSLGCWGGIPRNVFMDYEVNAYIIPGRFSTCFTRDTKNANDELDEFPEGINTFISCYANANDKPHADKTVMIGFLYNNYNPNISGQIEYHGDNPPDRVYFFISLIDGKYVSDITNLEELTGLTIEEMVETAELNRKGFEDLMYAMKAHEPEESKNDLNSNLLTLYAITAYQIVILLTLWIIILVAILKSMPSNKNRRTIS